jgi:RHS repeat-associated protein
MSPGRVGTWLSLAYNSSNHVGSYSYDANGNVTGDGAHNYTWDAEGRVTQVTGGTSWTMAYDALGRRVEQIGSAAKEFLYGPDGRILALMNGPGVSKAFAPLPAGATAVYTHSTVSYYRHPDWLGSSRIASTAAGALSYDGAYSAFGETIGEVTPGGGSSDRTFTGQNQLLETDLYDFPAREYKPGNARWLSPDPAGVGAVNPANPQSWNRYAYVNGSPLNSVDPLGLDPLCVRQGSCDNTRSHGASKP